MSQQFLQIAHCYDNSRHKGFYYMAEKVQTGGTKTFAYDKSSQSELNEKEKREIEKAYQKADERKAREKRNKIIVIVTVILLVLIIISAFLILQR